MQARIRARESEFKARRDLALLTAYYAAALQGADFRKLSFEKFREAFEPKKALSLAELNARLDRMVAFGLAREVRE